MALQSEPHPWLRPRSRRIGVTVFCALWLGFESWSEVGSLWFWLALAALGWAIWDFFLSDTYRGEEESPR